MDKKPTYRDLLNDIESLYNKSGPLGKLLSIEGIEIDRLPFPKKKYMRMTPGVNKKSGLNILSLGGGGGNYLPIEKFKIDNHFVIDLVPNEKKLESWRHYLRMDILEPHSNLKPKHLVFDAIDFTFILGYISKIPEDFYQQNYVADKILAIAKSANELGYHYTEGELTMLATDPIISKVYAIDNWLERLSDKGFITIVYSTEVNPNRRTEGHKDLNFRELFENAASEVSTAKDLFNLNLIDLSIQVAKSMYSKENTDVKVSLEFMERLVEPKIKQIHIKHDFYNDTNRVQESLAILERMHPNLKIENQVLNFARTGYAFLTKT